MNHIIPRIPFYFIRHGETDWNAHRKLMGFTDIPINQNGQDQAYEAAHVLSSIEINKIYSSPLQRTAETSKIISQICGLEIIYSDGLKERNWGDLEGHNSNQMVSALSDDNIPTNAEKFVDFEKRIFHALKHILHSNLGYPLIVSHGGVFKVLAHLLAPKYNIDCPNCQVFFFCPSAFDQHWDINII